MNKISKRGWKNLKDASRTQPESVFEQYLDSQNLKWNKIPESTQKQPDYKVAHGSMTCVFDVKEFDDAQTNPIGGFSPCLAFREKIRAASKKFKHKEATDARWSYGVKAYEGLNA